MRLICFKLVDQCESSFSSGNLLETAQNRVSHYIIIGTQNKTKSPCKHLTKILLFYGHSSKYQSFSFDFGVVVLLESFLYPEKNVRAFMS